jgi:hypothetical protein
VQICIWFGHSGSVSIIAQTMLNNCAMHASRTPIDLHDRSRTHVGDKACKTQIVVLGSDKYGHYLFAKKQKQKYGHYYIANNYRQCGGESLK